jgi:iron complex outermembrane recepter protein
MNSNKLSLAIAAVLGGSVGSLVYAATAADADTGSDAIQEITVTAQRRSQSMQDVPIQIQALTGETLTQLSVTTIDDFVKYLPNVTMASAGPGQGNIYMRGLSVGASGNQTSGGTGSFPNVAIYLDEQSGQVPGRNLDVYAADLERVEVLEGPQGTLFGAGAQAGVLRYITNKPKLDVTEGTVDAGYGYTAHGDPNSNVDTMINLPLIPDTLAVRAVIYDDTRGGYINNVPGTFARQSTDLGIHYAGYTNNVPGPATPLNSANNNNLVANAINPVTYQGVRAEVLWKFSDDWNALLAQSYQDMNSQGVFYETPQTSSVPAVSLPDLSVQLYNPSYDKDRFENTALTVNGRVGDLKLVYAGGYLVRNVEQVQDYTNYARGVFADYYQCLSPAQTGKAAQCFSPSSTWQVNDKDTHQSHELRLSTPDNWRVRVIGGLFWEDYQIEDTVNWLFKTAPGFTAIAPAPGLPANDPSIRNNNVAFLGDTTRGYTQKAAFTSLDVDIIPKTLTFTAGTRYYKFDNTDVGSTVSSFGCFAAGPPPCEAGANPRNLHSTYSGFKSRANLSWRISPDILAYYTWSQGFRPGGFNAASNVVLNGEFVTPRNFAPDTLTNNELGWKTRWADQRFEFNGAVYQEDWTNVQVSIFDPQAGLGDLVFTTNGPNYRVRGIETQVIARVTHGLTLTGAASWNSSNQTNSPYLIGTNGQPILSIPNPYGAIDSPLAQAPAFQGNLRARYEFDFGDYHAFWQIGAQRQDHSYSATGNVQAYDQPAFTTYDASIGAAKDAWTVQLYGQNLTDTRAILYANSQQFIQADYVNRPRIAGLKFSYKF